MELKRQSNEMVFVHDTVKDVCDLESGILVMFVIVRAHESCPALPCLDSYDMRLAGRGHFPRCDSIKNANDVTFSDIVEFYRAICPMDPDHHARLVIVRIHRI